MCFLRILNLYPSRYGFPLKFVPHLMREGNDKQVKIQLTKLTCLAIIYSV